MTIDHASLSRRGEYTRYQAWLQLYDDRPSHSHNAGTEHRPGRHCLHQAMGAGVKVCLRIGVRAGGGGRGWGIGCRRPSAFTQQLHVKPTATSTRVYNTNSYWLFKGKMCFVGKNRSRFVFSQLLDAKADDGGVSVVETVEPLGLMVKQCLLCQTPTPVKLPVDCLQIFSFSCSIEPTLNRLVALIIYRVFSRHVLQFVCVHVDRDARGRRNADRCSAVNHFKSVVSASRPRQSNANQLLAAKPSFKGLWFATRSVTPLYANLKKVPVTWYVSGSS